MELNVGGIRFAVDDLGVVDSVVAFVTELFKFRASIGNRKIWYRGQGNASHGLLPTVGRKHKYAGRELQLDREQERQILHRFRRRAYPLVGRSMTAGEALFLARHHKLPTRLLDWSANVMVGLYFTCTSEPCEDGTLWGAVRRDESQNLDAFDLARQETEARLFRFIERNEPCIKLLHPFYNSPRILAQDGAFTLQDDPWRAIESYAGHSFLAKNLDLERILRWKVPVRAKNRIIEELSGMGITHRIVYPDLDGIAQSLLETEVLWRGDAGPGMRRTSRSA